MRPVAGDDRAGRQLQLAPPDDVGEVTEGAAHGDAGALVRLGGRVRQHRHLDAEQRRGDGRAEERLAYRSSSGWAMSATHAGMSSGRVVSM
jgi:hypothetical protein